MINASNRKPCSDRAAVSSSRLLVSGEMTRLWPWLSAAANSPSSSSKWKAPTVTPNITPMTRDR